MRKTQLGTLLLSACLIFATSGVAWAHVVVTPQASADEAAPGDFATLILNVPTEKQVPTTKVRVEVPDGFTVEAVQPVPGWKHEFERKRGVVTAIVWSGGEIRPEEFQQFLISAQTPQKAGDYSWPAIQTYSDGSVVRWTGPESAETPASVVHVGSGSSASHSHEEGSHSSGMAEEAASREPLPSTGGTTPTAVYVLGGIAAGAVLLGAALTVSLRRGWGGR